MLKHRCLKFSYQIAYALEYLHDADLCEYGEENIRILEELLTKFGIHYTSQIS